MDSWKFINMNCKSRFIDFDVSLKVKTCLSVEMKMNWCSLFNSWVLWFLGAVSQNSIYFFLSETKEKVEEHRNDDAICKYILTMWDYEKGHCQLTLTSEHHTIWQNC